MTARSLALLGVLCLVAACATSSGSSGTNGGSGTSDTVDTRDFEGATAGRQYFEARCGHCHDLPLPSSESPSDWPDYVEDMAQRAKLNARAKQLVTLYLVAASQTAGGG